MGLGLCLAAGALAVAMLTGAGSGSYVVPSMPWPSTDTTSADGRRAVVAVTDAGRAVITARRAQSVRYLAAAFEREFTAAERRRLLTVLPLLDRLTERL